MAKAPGATKILHLRVFLLKRECQDVCVKETLKRSYHHGDLRSALLKAGEKALQENGVEGFSLRDLSRELGVSSGAPGRHFVSKQALLDEIALNGFQRLGKLLDEAVADQALGFELRMTRMSLAYIGFATENKSLLHLMMVAKHNKNAPLALHMANYRAWAAGAATVRDGQASGDVIDGDAAKLAMLIFVATEGLVSMYTENLFGTSVEAFAEEMVRLTVIGFRPRT